MKIVVINALIIISIFFINAFVISTYKNYVYTQEQLKIRSQSTENLPSLFDEYLNGTIKVGNIVLIKYPDHCYPNVFSYLTKITIYQNFSGIILVGWFLFMRILTKKFLKIKFLLANTYLNSAILSLLSVFSVHIVHYLYFGDIYYQQLICF